MEKGGGGFSAGSRGASSAPSFSGGGFESGPSFSSAVATKSTPSVPSGNSLFKNISLPSSNSIINIKNGTEEKSSFARSHNLENNKSIFDTSRPVKDHPIEKHESGLNGSIRTKEHSIIDLKHGKSEKPFFHKPKDLNQEKKMIDLNRPISPDPIFERPHISSHKINQHKLEEKGYSSFRNIEFKKGESTSPLQHEKVNPFKDTVTLWSRSENPQVSRASQHTTKPEISDQSSEFSIKPANEPRLKPQNEEGKNTKSSIEIKSQHEIDSQVKKVTEMVSQLRGEIRPQLTTLPKVETKARLETQKIPSGEVRPLTVLKTRIETQSQPLHEVEVVPITRTQPQIETKMVTHTKLRTEVKPLVEVVTISPQADQVTLRKIQTDVEYAQKTIPKVMEATGVSYEVAQKTVVKILLEKHEELSTELEMKAEQKPLQKVLTENRTEKKVREELKEPPQKKRRSYQETLREKVLYYEMDKEVNERRKDVIKKAISRLHFFKKVTGHILTGKEVSQLLQKNVSKDLISEVAEPTYKDGSWEEIVNEFEKIEIIDEKNDKGIVDELVEENTAVRLTFDRPTQDEAEKKDAEKVYGGPLNRVDAYVEEDRSQGELYENLNGKDVYYVTNKNGFELRQEEDREQE